MSEQSLQARMDALDAKMDLLLEYVKEQKQKSEMVEDLVADVSIIGKDVYDSTVEELNNRSIELEPAELTQLGIQFLRNIPNFIALMNTLESTLDLLKEAGPIVNEMIIDTSKKLGEFEQKGYFDFLRESGRIIDNIVTGISPEDMRALADNVGTLLEIMKRLMQPEMLNTIDKAVNIYSGMEIDKTPEYGLWKTMRAMNSKEMKKSLGFMMTFLQKLSKSIINQ